MSVATLYEISYLSMRVFETVETWPHEAALNGYNQKKVYIIL